MAENKTRQTNHSVQAFLNGVDNTRRREDARVVIRMMKTASGLQPKMWGPSIIGFGVHHYRLANGKIGEICKIGFSPRKQALAFYLADFEGREKLMQSLGKYSMGKGCLYINKLEDINLDVLQQVIDGAFQHNGSAPC